MFNKPTSGFESKKVTVSGVGRDESAWITFGKLTLGKHWFMVEIDMFCNMKEENLHNNMKVMNALSKKKNAISFQSFQKNKQNSSSHKNSQIPVSKIIS
jgi:hypothetical protein